MEVIVRTAIGGVLFAAFLVVAWHAVVRTLWTRGVDPPLVRAAVTAP
jgi:hypothetical protein